MSKKTKTYQCYMCDGVFNDGENWTEEERQAEYEQNFGDKFKDDELVLTCDKCYEVVLNNIEN